MRRIVADDDCESGGAIRDPAEVTRILRAWNR